MIIDLRDAQTHAARPEPCASGCWDIPTTTWDPGLPSGGCGEPVCARDTGAVGAGDFMG